MESKSIFNLQKVLQSLVDDYNNSRHSTTKYKPIDAIKLDIATDSNKINEILANQKWVKIKKTGNLILEIGDKVNLINNSILICLILQVLISKNCAITRDGGMIRKRGGKRKRGLLLIYKFNIKLFNYKD